MRPANDGGRGRDKGGRGALGEGREESGGGCPSCGGEEKVEVRVWTKGPVTLCQGRKWQRWNVGRCSEQG